MRQTRNPSLRKFVDAIREHFSPDLILLFGSRARGDQREWSDYGLIVVSESFKGIRVMDRMTQALRFHPGDIALDVLCYTPEEFEYLRERLGIVKTALEEGKYCMKPKRKRHKRSKWARIRREELESLRETIEILSDKDLMRQIEGSMRDIAAGRVSEIRSVSDLREEWTEEAASI